MLPANNAYINAFRADIVSQKIASTETTTDLLPQIGNVSSGPLNIGAENLP